MWTVLPLPAEVAHRLRSGQSLEGMSNIPGSESSKTRASFCVRCLVWRPPGEDGRISHHCSVCQRCTLGFDHHCHALGRCIVDQNIWCFKLLVTMLPVGVLTV